MANLTAEEFYKRSNPLLEPSCPGAEARERAVRLIMPSSKKWERVLLAVNVSKELGGEGAGVVAYANAVKRIAEADASIAVTMAVTNMVGEVIQQFGTDAQKKHYCPKLASGEFFAGAFALSEPGSGSDAASLQTKAIREGDHWIISGQKMWITSGTEAGVFVVWARTSGSGAKGITCFLVDKGATGLEIGKPEHKMGLKASHTVRLHSRQSESPTMRCWEWRATASRLRWSHLMAAESASLHRRLVSLPQPEIGLCSDLMPTKWIKRSSLASLTSRCGSRVDGSWRFRQHH